MMRQQYVNGAFELSHARALGIVPGVGMRPLSALDPAFGGGGRDSERDLALAQALNDHPSWTVWPEASR